MGLVDWFGFGAFNWLLLYWLDGPAEDRKDRQLRMRALLLGPIATMFFLLGFFILLVLPKER